MSTPLSTAPTTNHCGPLNNQRFRNLWTIQSRFQKSLLCAIGVSTGGTSLASASLDSNLIFIDFKTGRLIGVLDFQSRFHVTSILWYSDSLLYAGCANGVLFVITYNPTTKCPITMCPILQPFDDPITALALDPIRNFLAVGCGGDTFVFSRPVHDALGSWDRVDHIPAPLQGHLGLVTSLGFFGTSMEHRRLFIGHAKAGFCVWRSPRDFERIPYDMDKTVCSIGSAAFSPDGGFIAIATLDHSVVVYPLSQNGPLIHQRQVIQNKEHGGSRPIIPVALASNNLVLRGSTSGRVPIIDLQSGPLAPIENGSREVIRVLATYGDKVIVGLSDTVGHVSQIKCYLDLTSPASTYNETQPDSDQPLFEVAIGDLEEQGGVYCTPDPEGLIVHWWRKFPFAQYFEHWGVRLLLPLRCRKTWIKIGYGWLFIMILIVDPPELPVLVYGDLNTNQSAAGLRSTSTHVSRYTTSPPPPTEYPGLAFLISWCGLYVATRVTWWGSWLLGCLVILLGVALRTFVSVTSIFPWIIRFSVTSLPTFLSATICEILKAYADVPICPR